jgi:hypothetical protein
MDAGKNMGRELSCSLPSSAMAAPLLSISLVYFKLVDFVCMRIWYGCGKGTF